VQKDDVIEVIVLNVGDVTDHNTPQQAHTGTVMNHAEFAWLICYRVWLPTAWFNRSNMRVTVIVWTVDITLRVMHHTECDDYGHEWRSLWHNPKPTVTPL